MGVVAALQAMQARRLREPMEMTMGAVVVFWLCLLGVGYAYVGYVALLWVLTKLAGRQVSGPPSELQGNLPAVTMIVSAYNEEKVIGDKIRNALALDYPAGLLEIVVVSDGSTDGTAWTVSDYADRGVVLRHYEGRVGKTACLNWAVPLARGEIVVFSDANSSYTTGALKALMRGFEDPSVGFVTGWTKYGSGDDTSAADSLGLYSRLELITKSLESRLGSCVGADGAIFAIRKQLYSPLKDYDINDFVIPLVINEKGYCGVLARGAVCLEKDAGGAKGEFHRQVRITNRTIRAIFNHRQLLNPFKFGLFSIQLFSHKLCKFLVPFFLLGLLVSNFLLISKGGFFLAAAFAQLAFYAFAGLGGWMAGRLVTPRIATACASFIMVNLAIVWAWAKYAQGETYTTWLPTKR